MPVGKKRKRGRKPGQLTRKQKKQAHARKFFNTPEAKKKQTESRHVNTIRNQGRDRLRRPSQLKEPPRLIEEMEETPPNAFPPPTVHQKQRFVTISKQSDIKKPFTPGMDTRRQFQSFWFSTPEQLDDITQWVIKWSHADHTSNATAADVKDYIFESTNVHMTTKSVVSLLKALGFKWKLLLNGYYFKKAMEPWVIEHRKGVIEVLEYFEEHPGWFQVYYQDEAAFRTHVTQKYSTHQMGMNFL